MPTRAARKSSAKKASFTIGDLVGSIAKISATQLLYVLLLVAALLIGYLVARVQTLEKGTASQTAGPVPTSAAAAAPAAPTAPDAKTVMAKLKNGDFPAKGNPNAKVKIVEFADLRCPFCKAFFTDTESQLFKDYVDTGKAVFYFRQYAFLGPASTVAANAAECANEQGQFWAFHDYLYQNQPDESDTSMYKTDTLTTDAANLGMNADQFRNCLSANKYNNKVSQDMSDGQAVGVSGTPTFYINGKQLVGAVPYSNFQQIIDPLLK